MTTRLRGPLEQSQNTAKHDSPVLLPEIGLFTFPLLLVGQDRFEMLPQAFVDIFKFLQVLDLLESIYRSDQVMFRSRCTSIWLNASLASS